MEQEIIKDTSSDKRIPEIFEETVDDQVKKLKSEMSREAIKEELITAFYKKNQSLGVSPVLFAIQKKARIEEITSILKDTNSKETDEGFTPLQLATLENNVHALKVMLREAETDVNNCSKRGTALHLAVQEGKKQATEVLMALKGKLDIPDLRGICPMDLSPNREFQEFIDQKKMEMHYYEELKEKKLGLVFGKIRMARLIPGTLNSYYIVLNPFDGEMSRYRKPGEGQPLKLRYTISRNSLPGTHQIERP